MRWWIAWSRRWVTDTGGFRPLERPFCRRVWWYRAGVVGSARVRAGLTGRSDAIAVGLGCTKKGFGDRAPVRAPSAFG